MAVIDAPASLRAQSMQDSRTAREVVNLAAARGHADIGAIGDALNDRGDPPMQFDQEFDARGLSCPLPIVKTKKALNAMSAGQVLKVKTTDPGSVKDMEAFANQTGNALVSTEASGVEYVFYLRKG
jgi:tRNA 2-thiouridine synthesizing protein A